MIASLLIADDSVAQYAHRVQRAQPRAVNLGVLGARSGSVVLVCCAPLLGLVLVFKSVVLQVCAASHLLTVAGPSGNLSSVRIRQRAAPITERPLSCLVLQSATAAGV